MKRIGILGGMGPLASLEFHKRLMHKFLQNGAIQDTDFPHVNHMSLPLESFTEEGFSDSDVMKIKNQLIEGVKVLEQANSDFIVIVCNTVHFMYEDLSNNVNIPILHLIQAVVDKIKQDKQDYVGILSSSTTRRLKLYEDLLDKNNIAHLALFDEEQRVIDNVILNIMKGKTLQSDKNSIYKIIKRMKSFGVNNFILGCTELPILLPENSIGEVNLFSSIDILRDITFEKSF